MNQLEINSWKTKQEIIYNLDFGLSLGSVLVSMVSQYAKDSDFHKIPAHIILSKSINKFIVFNTSEESMTRSTLWIRLFTRGKEREKEKKIKSLN